MTAPIRPEKPRHGQAGRRTAKEFDDERRALAADADKALGRPTQSSIVKQGLGDTPILRQTPSGVPELPPTEGETPPTSADHYMYYPRDGGPPRALGPRPIEGVKRPMKMGPMIGEHQSERPPMAAQDATAYRGPPQDAMHGNIDLRSVQDIVNDPANRANGNFPPGEVSDADLERTAAEARKAQHVDDPDFINRLIGTGPVRAQNPQSQLEDDLNQSARNVAHYPATAGDTTGLQKAPGVGEYQGDSDRNLSAGGRAPGPAAQAAPLKPRNRAVEEAIDEGTANTLDAVQKRNAKIHGRRGQQ